MTSPDKPRAKDHHFNSFAMGVAVGVGAALLFGTEEGKRLTKNLFDSLPDTIKNLKDEVTPEFLHNQSLYSEPESTPHTYAYNEPPPPPAPHVIPTPPSLRV